MTEMKMHFGKKAIVVGIVLMLFIARFIGLSTVVYAAGESVIVPNVNERTLTVTASQSVFIAPNIELNNFGFQISSAKLVIENLPNDATTSYSSVAGLAVSYDSSKDVYTITGTAASSDYQTLFRSFKINCGTTLQNDIKFNFIVSENTTTPMYYSGTKHYYEYISSPAISWTAAAVAASSKTYNGMEGYLVTITSEGENTFVVNKMAESGWIGASDAASNGIWQWSTGPEAGTQFWQGYQPSASPIGGFYNNWEAGEPNRDSLEGNYAHIFVNSPPPFNVFIGTWNDMPDSNTFVQGYAVEYGGMPGDAPEDFDETVTVHIGASVIYNANGATSGTVPTDNNSPYASGDSVTVLTNSGTLTKAGFVFDGWNTQADGQGTHYNEAGFDTFVISSNITLYSEWVEDSDGDGVSDTDEVSTGTNPNDPNDKPQKGTITVTVYEHDGSPGAGFTCVLNSTPVVITTDANGVALFSDVDLTPHTLILRSGNVQIGTYSLYFTESLTNSTNITDDASTDSNGSVSTFVARDFQSLNLTIQRNASNFWQLEDASYTQIVAVNPRTGDYRSYINKLWIWILISVALMGGSIITYITVKKKSIQ